MNKNKYLKILVKHFRNKVLNNFYNWYNICLTIVRHIFLGGCVDTIEKLENENKNLINENKKLKAHILKLQAMVNDCTKKLKKEKYENNKLIHQVNKEKYNNQELSQKLARFFK